MKALFCIASFALCLPCLVVGADEPVDSTLINFGTFPFQEQETLSSQWKKLAPDKRKEIEHFLLHGLGLSSTGTIRLIGVYPKIGNKEKNGVGHRTFHFQQLDLGGARLFWSVLIDPEASTARVLYDVNSKAGKGPSVSTKDKMPKL